jgi:hypothetical protein
VVVLYVKARIQQSAFSNIHALAYQRGLAIVVNTGLCGSHTWYVCNFRSLCRSGWGSVVDSQANKPQHNRAWNPE